MSKIYDAIMGLVVADAVGVPVEFKARGTFNVTDMIGYGTYNQPPGTWSDDSSMTLATVESMARLGKIDPGDIMNNFARWLYDKEFTPYGKVFDAGMTTQIAVGRYKSGTDYNLCGGDDVRDNGNGSLMRILPLAFTDCDDETIEAVSSLTHAHEISRTACKIYVHIARDLIAGKKLEDLISNIHTERKEFGILPLLKVMRHKEVRSTGYVVHTLEAALWCLLNSKSYRECVLLAVNLGEDTDTIAAVAGGLASIIYGRGRDNENGIPEEWISQIARKEWIEELCGSFAGKFPKYD